MKKIPLPSVRSLTALAALILTATASAAPSSTTRPNIVVIMTDDMGFSDIGCYGSEIRTPNLDSLAHEGVRLTQFYNNARCCPTRASLLTGVYSHQAGIGHMTQDKGLEAFSGELNNRCVTIAEVLKPAGYRTYASGKWHVSLNTKPDGPKHDWPLQRGFERYYGTIAGAGSYFDPGTLTRDNQAISPFADPEYRPTHYFYTDAIADNAVRFATEHARDHASEPFFLYVAFTAAHWPLHAKPEDIAKYKGQYDAGYEAIRQARFAKAKQLGVIDPNWTISPTVGDWAAVPDKAWEARCMEVYAAQVDCMDQGVGRIVDALKKNGQFDNTLVLFLQDNGACAETTGREGKGVRSDHPSLPTIAADALRAEVIPKQTREGFPVLNGKSVLPGPADTYIAYGEGWANVSNTPFRLYKHFDHEGGISTPLIAHWPAQIGRHDALEKQPGHLIDIMATCVKVAGATYPEERNGTKITPLQGVSLLPAFAGQPLNRPTPIFFEHEGNRAVRDGKWKLVAKGPGGQWELYDTEADRTETHDVSAANAELTKQLGAKWEAWAKTDGVLPWPWKPAYGQPAQAGDTSDAGAKQLHFALKQGDSLAGQEAPALTQRGLAIRVEISEPVADGVLLAQGGSAGGYVLYLKEGRLNFSLRLAGKLETIQARDPLPSGPAIVSATLGKDGEMTLKSGDQVVASGHASLLTRQPKDGLQVGRDEGGAVGDYAAPFPYRGKVGAVTLDLQE